MEPVTNMGGGRASLDPKPTWSERLLARGLAQAFGTNIKGRLDVGLPSGATVSAGQGRVPQARITLKSWKPLWRLGTRGSLGLAESYMRGEIDTADLGEVLRFGIANFDRLHAAGGGVLKERRGDICWHRRRANTKTGSRRNIAAHYDLGNDFYRLWLDSGMAYSSALFRTGNETLQTAQDEKYRVVLDCLGVAAGQRVLEIGCGWGGFAEAACRRGAHVTGLTISAEQLGFAQRRLARAGFADLAGIRFEDYRDSSGTFDRIASIEMIEAVGEDHWPVYFQTLADRLNPGGTAAIQAITIEERFFASYRLKADFIQRYIFPGGMLPTVERMRDEAAAAGLAFETVERFGLSYARTLDLWRKSFRANWPAIKALGFDERFRRMWEYYLTYCEVGFEAGDVDVGIYRLRKV